ncbi:MAG: hypothetical protein WC496_03420 [Phycisphaerae bacterium]|jgi:hypothetical protein
MAKKLILIVLAGVALLAVTENTFAFGGRSRGGHGRDYHRGFRGGVIIIPPRIRPVVIFPPRRIIISPTIVFGSTTTVRETIVDETVIIWVANDNGSKTEVRLTRASDGGYIGPRGEYYSYMPTEDQLRTLYGIKTVQTKPANFTVWITNDNGSQTPITLTPSGNGFIGPSNEFYPAMPTEEQLKALYGLRTNTSAENSVTVWIDYVDGNKLPIVLSRQGEDYVGPKGEHYANVPSKEQLQMIYGQKPKKVDSGNTVIWINNSDGSKTPITLQKNGSVYTGPAGEKYTSLPTEEQLKLLYGTGDNGGQQGELNFEITKNDGTKTVVVLKKEGSEFVGPKGERYPDMPTEEQLKLIYGK